MIKGLSWFPWPAANTAYIIILSLVLRYHNSQIHKIIEKKI